MPFIGKSPQVGAFQLIDSITTSATDTYALTVSGSAYVPESARNLIVSLNGVTQAPESAYTVSGSNIVFASALTASDVIDYILVIGDAVDIGTPSDNTVGDAQLKPSLNLSSKTLTFANDQISGDVINGGTISSFASTGIDDNATSTAITIDASENVGIGTAPSKRLHIDTATNGGILLEDSANSITGIFYSSGSNSLALGSTSNHPVKFFANNSERMRLDASGNVGIGTTSPTTKLHIEGNTNGLLASKVSNTNTGASARADFTVVSDSADITMIATSAAYTGVSGWADSGIISTSSSTSGGMLFNVQASAPYRFVQGATNERMRIDSSGNLLVGKTAAGIGTDGVQIQPDGGGVFTTNGATSLLVNRRTSDGTIIDVRKDNATVGNIGVATSELYLSSGNTGLYFDDVNNHIRPTNGSGAARDNTVDLGSSSNRFKDLHLSGTAYAGNVGVNTTSAPTPLTVAANSGAGAVALNGRSSDNIATLSFYASNGTTSQGYVQGRSDSLRVWAASGDSLSLGANDSEKMTIDLGGRQVISHNQYSYASVNYFLKSSTGTGNVYMGNVNGLFSLSTNGYYYGASLRQLDTGKTSLGEFQIATNGAFYFNRISGATAGSLASTTTSVTITDAGRLGIGTTSPATNLHIIDSNPVVRLQSSGAGTDNTLSFLSRNISNVGAYADIIADGAGHNSTNAPIVFTQGSGQTERMRIDSNGRVVIQGGVSYAANAPSYRGNLIIANAASNTTTTGGLEFMSNSGGGAGYGSRIASDSSGGLRFETRTNSAAWSERMSIASSGNVGIGTSSPGNQLHVVGGIRFSSTGADANRWNVYWNSATGDLIVVSSDARLKKDFDYDIAGIETVNKLKPVRYTWKENNKRQLGFTAQESLEADEHLAWHDTESDQWGLDGWEGYAAVLTKAIQEQQAMIETLQAEVAALKGA